jgi:ABC-type transport system involved in cytochrome c biogenesis permease subunit
MQSVLFWSATTCYSAATVLLFVWLACDKDWGGVWGTRLAACGLVPHGAGLALRWIEVGHGPYNTRYEIVSSDTFILVLAYLVTVRFVRRFAGVGVVVMPAAFLLMGAAVSSFGVKHEVPIIFRSYWLILHVGFAKAFAATAILAAGCAVSYLLKARSPAGLSRLPALERLELYTGQLLLLSFLLLGVMIVAGSLWAHQSWGRYWGWDPIETASFVCWMIYGIVLHLRSLHRWSGRRLAYVTIAASVLAIFALFVAILLVPTIHNSTMVGK